MAENQVNSENMAVSVIETTVSRHSDINNSEHDLDRKASFDSNPKKKSCFQITKVIPKSGGSDQVDGDFEDELDETNTEEVSSMSFDASKTNDTMFDHQSLESASSPQSTPSGNEEFLRDLNVAHTVSSTPEEALNNHEPHTVNHVPEMDTFESKERLFLSDGYALSTEPPHSLPQPLLPGKDKPSESRFKVVKIESNKPFIRGRWSCQDYRDPPSSEKGDKDKQFDEIGSGNSSTSSSVHYVPGIDDPSRNPMGDFQNGDHSVQSPVLYKNGAQHITNASALPSQPQIPTQVPSSSAQTVVPQSELAPQYAGSSTVQQAGVVNGQQSANTQSFNQTNVPPTQAVQSNQVQSGEPGTDFLSTSQNISNIQQQVNAQTTHDSALSSHVQSSSSQEFNNNAQQQQTQQQHQSQAFQPQTLDVPNTNATTGGDNASVSSTSGDNASAPDAAPFSPSSTGFESDKPEPLDATEALGQELYQRMNEGSTRQALAPPLLEMVTQRINDRDDDRYNNYFYVFLS